MERQTKGGVDDTKFRRLEEQQMMSFSLGGDRQFGKLKADWAATYSKASEERPNERYIEYVAEDLEFIPDFSNQFEPKITSVLPSSTADLSSDYELGEITEEFQFTEDVDRNFRLNFTLPLLEDKYKNSIKFGLRYRGKDKSRNNQLFEYTPLDEGGFDNNNALRNTEDITKDNYLAGDYTIGNFVDKEFLGDLDLNKSSLFEKEEDIEERAENFSATENITGAYVMLSQNIGSKLLLLAGLRIEHTNLSYRAFGNFRISFNAK